MTTKNTDILCGPGRRSPDVRDTLKILEQLHNRIGAATPSPFDASLPCRCLCIILQQTSEKRIPHYILHEINGVLGSLRKSCILLRQKGQAEPVTPGFAALIIHLEMRLSRFLALIVSAIHYKDKEHNNWNPFEGVKERRQNLVAHIRRMDDCLEKGQLPSADEEVDVVAKFPPPKELGYGSLWRVYRDSGDWAFQFAPCIECMAVPDSMVRMSGQLGYVPDM